MISRKSIGLAFAAVLSAFSMYGQLNMSVQGWNILSDSFEDDMVTIAAARSYNINHLQLSGDLVMDLQEI
ncbi:MAG TPA: hypothetical protein P5180_14260, partial [Bacteroidales bacterium]|nr:hypothetical protein [Bacteroidales bacterium]